MSMQSGTTPLFGGSAVRWRRGLVSVAASAGMAAALLFGAPAANADVLDDLAQQYSIGAGAGQVARYLNHAITLRNQGYPPKASDYQAIAAAMDRGANQAPLIEALNTTVSNQLKAKNRMPSNQVPGERPVIIDQGDWDPGNPMEQDDMIFPMPGR